MSFLNSIPLPILVLLGFAVLGFCDCLKKLYTWSKKIDVFSNYRERLVAFHNNVRENNDFDSELSDYLLENALKINLNSIIRMNQNRQMLGISTGMMNIINDIVTRDCYDFTETCRNFHNVLTQNIGFFKDKFQETRSKIINPIYLVKNGVSLIFNRIPIVNRLSIKFKDFFLNLFVLISVVETLLSLFSQKSLIQSIIRQITEWIS